LIEHFSMICKENPSARAVCFGEGAGIMLVMIAKDSQLEFLRQADQVLGVAVSEPTAAKDGCA
jgi:hypothetical protein